MPNVHTCAIAIRKEGPKCHRKKILHSEEQEITDNEPEGKIREIEEKMKTFKEEIMEKAKL